METSHLPLLSQFLLLFLCSPHPPLLCLLCPHPFSHPALAVHLYMSQTSIEIDSSDGMISDPSTGDSSSSSEEERSSDEEEDDDSDWWRAAWRDKRVKNEETDLTVFWREAKMVPAKSAKRELSWKQDERKKMWSWYKEKSSQVEQRGIIGHQWTASRLTASRKKCGQIISGSVWDMLAIDGRHCGSERPWSQNQDCIVKRFLEI